MTHPVFALIGAVNHGKSSIAATLLEQEDLGISSDPGHTCESQRLEYCSIPFSVWDTPGFQNPRMMLDELAGDLINASQPLLVFKKFAEKYENSKEFWAERQICKVLCKEPAAILYVIDSSKQLETLHESEMELLQLTGRPRLAILNPTNEPKHESEWKAKLGQKFGAVTMFNAHTATTKERVNLVRTMATLVDEWRDTLHEVARGMEADWLDRMRASAGHIHNSLKVICQLQLKETVDKRSGENRQKMEKDLAEKVRKKLQAIEGDLYSNIRREFRFGKKKVTSDECLPVITGNFSTKEAWNLFVVAIPSTGHVWRFVRRVNSVSVEQEEIEKKVAESGWYGKAKKRLSELPRLSHFLPGFKTILTVGPPVGNDYFHDLLDRAMAVILFFSQRTHAVQDQQSLDIKQLKEILKEGKASIKDLPKKERHTINKFLKKIKKMKKHKEMSENEEEFFMEKLSEIIESNIEKYGRVKAVKTDTVR